MTEQRLSYNEKGDIIEYEHIGKKMDIDIRNILNINQSRIDIIPLDDDILKNRTFSRYLHASLLVFLILIFIAFSRCYMN